LPARVQSNATTILDLADVPYVSSAGLRVLLKGAKMAKASGHTLMLSGLSAPVQEVFDISGFSSIFQIETTVEAALARVS
jgi:anti-sigma B factor antagonist